MTAIPCGRESGAIEQAISVLRAGGKVAISDDVRVALVMAAQFVTAAELATFERATAAPAAVALGPELFDTRGLKLVQDTGTGFPRGVPVDLVADAMTAMSRAGRANTIRTLATGEGQPPLASPGHVTPIRSTPGNLLARVGVVEACVDIVAMAGLGEAALMAYLLDDDGATVAPVGVPTLSVKEVRTARLLSAGGLAHAEVGDLFKNSMSRLPAAVTVVTCYASSDDAAPGQGAATRPMGLVVSSMVSYSSTPPSIVFSISEASRSFAALTSTATFGVNVLASQQQDEVKIFSSRSVDKFADIDWRDRYGSPELVNAQSHLHCRKIGQFTLGDHTLIVGSIIAGSTSSVAPMVYYNRNFHWALAPAFANQEAGN